MDECKICYELCDGDTCEDEDCQKEYWRHEHPEDGVAKEEETEWREIQRNNFRSKDKK